VVRWSVSDILEAIRVTDATVEREGREGREGREEIQSPRLGRSRRSQMVRIELTVARTTPMAVKTSDGKGRGGRNEERRDAAFSHGG
jgi:hypothetical protein